MNSQDENNVEITSEDQLVIMRSMKKDTEVILENYKQLTILITEFNEKYQETTSNGNLERDRETNSLFHNTSKYTYMIIKEEKTIKNLEQATVQLQEPIKEVEQLQEPIKEVEQLQEHIKELKINCEAIDFSKDKNNSAWSDESVEVIYDKPKEDVWVKPKTKKNTKIFDTEKKYIKKNDGNTRTFKGCSVTMTDRMHKEDITEDDFKYKIQIRVAGEPNHLINMPNNILKLRDQGIDYVWNYDPLGNNEYKPKSPFTLRRGKEDYALCWLGSDYYLYVIDENNDLVICEFNGVKQKWRKTMTL